MEGGEGFSGDTMFREDAVRMGRSGECPSYCFVERSPLAAVFLHARVGVQEYKGETDKEAFEAFYEGCEHPLYYNRDILTLEGCSNCDRAFPSFGGE